MLKCYKIDYINNDYVKTHLRMITWIQKYLRKQKICASIKKKLENLNLLCGEDLSYVNLSTYDMRGAKLNNAILTGTVFRTTNLQGAVMPNTNLVNANLQGANLNYVNFVGANLSGANLSNALLYKTNFRGADLTGANLTDVRIDTTTDFTDALLIDVVANPQRIRVAIITNATISIKPSNYDKLLYKLGFKSNLSNHRMDPKKVIPFGIIPKT